MNRLGDKNPRCNDGKTPLHEAAEKGHLKVCEVILKNNQFMLPLWNGKTPLMLAAEYLHVDLCIFLAQNLKSKRE